MTEICEHSNTKANNKATFRNTPSHKSPDLIIFAIK